eukprot:CAMPEP_0182456464 /NCGR_PEP_ID=MMETSP1319-20130603/2288_1 /TAXON_ID=172717 /ORGANISM="Bolidomonas pacifica, Strain RCC208" /LENGTH=135 /DNA_ID=CAMNT_0024654709 /DNA_START=299 /DNA_END=703 /DNA_ORIENTATION=+
MSTDDVDDVYSYKSVVIGSGRFVRSVVLPSLKGPIYLYQPRSVTFLKSLGRDPPEAKDVTYEYDILGKPAASKVKLAYVGCLSLPSGRDHLLTEHLKEPPRLIILGLTEAGLNKDSAALKLLHALLLSLSSSSSS